MEKLKHCVNFVQQASWFVGWGGGGGSEWMLLVHCVCVMVTGSVQLIWYREKLEQSRNYVKIHNHSNIHCNETDDTTTAVDADTDNTIHILEEFLLDLCGGVGGTGLATLEAPTPDITEPVGVATDSRDTPFFILMEEWGLAPREKDMLA